MGIGLVVSRIENTKVVGDFVLECLEDIVEDGTTLTAVGSSVDVKKQCWVCVIEKGRILAVVQFKPFNRSLLEIHPFVPKRNRKKSEVIVRAAIKWIDENSPAMYKTLITNIPSCKRYAMIFALKMGFKQVGRYTNGYKKNGKYHDMVLYERGLS